jgi:hypothetical protein
MIRFTPGEVGAYYAARVPKLRQRGNRWRGPCPIHGGKHDNFSIDAKAGFYCCWSCDAKGDIVAFERARTGATFLEAVTAIEGIIGRRLLDRPTSRAEVRRAAEAAACDRRDLDAAEYFRVAAEMTFEHILEDLPEAAPERFAPTQALLEIRRAHGPSLLALYRDWRKREPRLTDALVFAGQHAWERLSTRLALFVDGGAEVRHVA